MEMRDTNEIDIRTRNNGANNERTGGSVNLKMAVCIEVTIQSPMKRTLSLVRAKFAKLIKLDTVT